jgi:hypothetical protein
MSCSKMCLELQRWFDLKDPNCCGPEPPTLEEMKRIKGLIE